MQSFHDVTFPLGVSFGATGGPERRNEIVLLTSGREKRNARFAGSRRHFDAGTGLRSLEDLHEVITFFEARRGSLHAFRFRDPFDMKSCRPNETPQPHDQEIGTGDGVTAGFQLVKVYGVGEDAYRRPISKPSESSVRVAVAGVEKANGADYTLDAATGVVTFMPVAVPPPGAAVTAGFEFDIPARFDTERIAISLVSFKAGQIPSIPIIEVKL